MRSYVAISLVTGIAACLMAACGFSGAELSDAASEGGAWGTTGSGGLDGDAGVDVEVGDDGGQPSPFTYAQFCGGGCTPESASPSDMPCLVDEGAGGNGGAGGAAEGDCSLVIGLSGSVNGECTTKNEAGTNSAPCFTAADCAPGFACVDDGKCRANCCGDVEACAEGTYCALQVPAPDEIPNGVVAPQIPVCELADHCMLFDANGGGCTGGKVCSIVRADGTTSCIDPGPGGAGDPCPCQAGHVCGSSINKCFQLCSLQSGASDCPSGYVCQQQSYTQPVGICVSQD